MNIESERHKITMIYYVWYVSDRNITIDVIYYVGYNCRTMEYEGSGQP